MVENWHLQSHILRKIFKNLLLLIKHLKNVFFRKKNWRKHSKVWNQVNSQVLTITSRCWLKLILDLCLIRRFSNLSLKQGICLEVAQVAPIFNKDGEYLLENCRPILVLPYFSKLLEKLLYNRLYSYLSEKNLIYEFQIQMVS